MGRLILIIYIFLSFLPVYSQDTASHLNKHNSIQGNFTDFTVDNIGNFYLVLNNEQLKKLNGQGDSVAVYSDVKHYGKITSVDASNPFKILVYYKEASTIVVLDRLLSQKNVIDLRKNHIQQAKAIRLSYDNNIWLYDEAEGKIRKMDENGKLLFESADLRNIFSAVPSFEIICDDNKTLFLYDPKLGWFVFDYYGAFLKRYAFLNWKDVQVLNGIMKGRIDTVFVSAKTGDLDFQTASLKIPLSGALKTLLSAKRIYALFPGKLEIFDAL